jgi:hypothetical protein
MNHRHPSTTGHAIGSSARGMEITPGAPPTQPGALPGQAIPRHLILGDHRPGIRRHPRRPGPRAHDIRDATASRRRTTSQHHRQISPAHHRPIPDRSHPDPVRASCPHTGRPGHRTERAIRRRHGRLRPPTASQVAPSSLAASRRSPHRPAAQSSRSRPSSPASPPTWSCGRSARTGPTPLAPNPR